MKMIKFAVLGAVMALAANANAEFNKYKDVGNFRADTAVINSATAVGGANGGLAVIGQDRTINLFVSGTTNISATVQGARDDGTVLKTYGTYAVGTAVTNPLTITPTVGVQKIIVSPTAGLTGTNALHVTATQGK